MTDVSLRPRRLLVLTSASGAGHDTHAHATAAWCDQLFGQKVDVRVEHALEDSHPFYRKAVDFYNFIQRRAPWFHHIYYNLIELLELLNPGTVSLGSDYYTRLLQEYRPDAILSVHDCINRGYFELAKKVLGPEVRCATYCTEFSGGYGFSRNWVNPRGDFWFGRTRDAMEGSPARRLRPGQAVFGGHWAPTAFYAEPLTPSQRQAYIRERLDLDPGRFILLLSTGGAGAQNHAAILESLKPLGDKIQVVALCGTNLEAKDKLAVWVEKNISFPVRLLGFTKEMATLLQVSSAVVARAGATTAGESLLCGCPIIFNALGGIMPQEMPTWRYFKKHGVGAMAWQSGDIARILRTWLNDPAILTAMRSRLGGLRDVTTPETALRHLLPDPG